MEEIEVATAAPAESADDPNAEAPALQPGEEAKSMVCNDCGKKFRSMLQANAHAERTQVERHIRNGRSFLTTPL